MRHRWTHQLIVWAATLSLVGLPWLYAGTTGRQLFVTDADFVNVDPATQSGWTSRLPTTGEKGALAGSSGAPSGTNRYVTSAEKGVAGGPASLGSDSMVTWTQLGSRDTHAPLAAASQLTPTATTMAIEGTTPVTLTTGNPRIAGCTTAAHDGRLLVLKGSHATNTVTMPNGQGVRLAGNTGSITFGRDRASALFVCDGNVPEWQQVAGGGLQQAFNDDNKILTGSTPATGFIRGNFASGNYFTDFWDAANANTPTTQAFCNSGDCDYVVRLGAGKNYLINKSDGSTLFSVNGTTGTVTGLTVPKQMLLMVQWARNTCPYTSYWSVVGNSAGVEAETNMVMTHSATVRNLRYRAPANIPAGETHTITIRKNGASTGLTCAVIQGGGTGSGELSDSSCANSASTFTVVAGDVIATQAVCSGGSSINTTAAISMELE